MKTRRLFQGLFVDALLLSAVSMLVLALASGEAWAFGGERSFNPQPEPPAMHKVDPPTVHSGQPPSNPPTSQGPALRLPAVQAQPPSAGPIVRRTAPAPSLPLGQAAYPPDPGRQGASSPLGKGAFHPPPDDGKPGQGGAVAIIDDNKPGGMSGKAIIDDNMPSQGAQQTAK